MKQQSAPHVKLNLWLSPSGVTVIWASPRFWHPYSQNPSDMDIPFSYYLSDLG